MAELPDRVTLRAGEEKVLPFPSLAGAGYRWNATVDDNSIVSAQVRFDDPPKSASGESSFSANELLVLHGLRAGSTQIRCIQRRSWEHDAPPLEDHGLAVEVSARSVNP